VRAGGSRSRRNERRHRREARGLHGAVLGYGQGEQVWRDIVSARRAVDYDYVMSIEHEDQLMSMDEGLRKAVALLQEILVREEKPTMWWA
jgi:sugar phosphate isomerase/epimerase